MRLPRPCPSHPQLPQLGRCSAEGQGQGTDPGAASAGSFWDHLQRVFTALQLLRSGPVLWVTPPVPGPCPGVPPPGAAASTAELVSACSALCCSSTVRRLWGAPASGCLRHEAGSITTLPVPSMPGEDRLRRSKSVPAALGWGQERDLKPQALGTLLSARGLALTRPMRPSWTLGCLFYSGDHGAVTPPMYSAAATAFHCALSKQPLDRMKLLL